MKSIFKYAICALFAGLTLTACSPEEYEGANGQVPDASQYADMFTVTVDQETNTATFTFTETQGVTPVWRVDGESYSSSTTFTKYWRKKGEHFVDCYVKNRNGMSKDPVRKTFVIEKTQMNGFGGLDKDSEHNLFNTANFETRSFYFADDNWAQIADPALTVGNDGKSFTLKIEQVGGQRWQGQFALNEMGIQTKAGTTYDFSAIITSNNPITTNGVKIKICQTDDDNAILMDKDFKIKQGNEPQCVYASELTGVDLSNAKVVFDFGGTPAGTEIIIEDFVLMETQYNNVEMPIELATPFDYNDSRNVWKQFDAPGKYKETTWFGDAGWADMGVTINCQLEGSHHKIVIPETTVNEQWHAQYSIDVELPVAMADAYDISVCVSTSKELPGMTLKFTEDGNDDNFFMADRVSIKGEHVWKYENVKLPVQDASKMRLVMDFAGAEKGTEIDIYDICVIKK